MLECIIHARNQEKEQNMYIHACVQSVELHVPAYGGNLGLQKSKFPAHWWDRAEERSTLYASIDRIDISAQGIEDVFWDHGKLVSYYYVAYYQGSDCNAYTM